ncbi:MAG: hypothetical protein HQ542_10690, partial [Bacteroidia bacterium]|nr:hypothetical protein [Bacteroidia bacterium]
DISFVKAIQNLFKEKVITITVSTDMDETEYLTSNPANEKHLLDNIATDSEVRYSNEEFKEYIDKLKESQ